MDIYIKLFEVLFPVFLSIGIGYWYGKKDAKFDTNFITTFSGNIGLPCIIFYSLTFSDIDFDIFLKFSLLTFVYVGIFSIIGIIVLKMIDSHCHLDHEPLLNNINEVLKRSKDVGIKKLLTICTTLKGFNNIKNILTIDKIIYGTFGIHPHETDNDNISKNIIVKNIKKIQN